MKDWLHRDLASRDKLLLILASFDQPAKLADLRSRSEETGFRLPKKWNLSDVLGKIGGMAIRVPAGWEHTDTGNNHLRAIGVESPSPPAVQVAADLRKHLANVQHDALRRRSSATRPSYIVGYRHVVYRGCRRAVLGGRG